VKVGRNDPCPCGSGLKYKKCCLEKELSDARQPAAMYAQRYKIRLKEQADIEGIRKAGRLVLDTLDLVESKIRPGMITDNINTIVHEFTIKNGAQPAPLNTGGSLRVFAFPLMKKSAMVFPESGF
jgi:methionyl aminopeptidase